MNMNLFYETGQETIDFSVSELQKHLALADPCLYFSMNPNPDSTEVLKGIRITFRLSGALLSPFDDSYRISFDNNKKEGAICGSNPRSVLLGVYAFLEQLGFRFLMPGEKGTVIPKTLPFAEDVSGSCCFHIEKSAKLRHRGICIEGADSIENIIDLIDWLPKAGYNSFFSQFREPYIFLNRWYDHINNPQYPKEDKTPAFYHECYRAIDREIQKRGLILHAGGHGWTCEAIGYPSNGWTSAEHAPSPKVLPLIAEVNGKRGLIDNIPMNTNLCYANASARKRFCDAVITYIKEHPRTDFLHVWLADEVNHVCECRECRKVSPTDQYIRLLNELDAALEQQGIDCHLVFLLYQELLYPPVSEHLIHPERFTLMFAPISRSFRVSYPDTFEPKTLPPFERNHMTLPVNIEENLTYLQEWKNHVSVESFIYDYPLGRAHYGDFGYLNISRVISEDIRQLSGMDMNGYMSCQELRVFMPNSFPNYLMGRLLFDTSLSFGQISKDYFQSAYGSQWELALRYLQTVSELTDCDYFNGKGPRRNLKMHKRYASLVEQIRAFLPKIRAAAAGAGSENIFWKLLDYHADYSILLGVSLCQLCLGNQAEADQNFAEFCRYIQFMEPQMQSYLDVYRIIEVSTKYTGFTMPE